LGKSFRYRLFKHVKEYSEAKGIHIDIINGVEDHVNCLIRLKTVQTPSNVVKQIKGESSRWVNKNVLIEQPFRWQKGYGVFSVDEKSVPAVRQYIYNQEEHHKTTSYKAELKKLVN